jgi:hypothetical protein
LKKYTCHEKQKKAVQSSISQLYVFYVGRILKANKRTWYDVITWEEEGQVTKQAAKETQSEEKRQTFYSQQGKSYMMIRRGNKSYKHDLGRIRFNSLLLNPSGVVGLPIFPSFRVIFIPTLNFS